MDFEDRIRFALKEDAQHIRVAPHVRTRLAKRLEHRVNFKKWLVTIGSAGVLLLGANSIVSAATGESLFDVIVHYTSASQGGAFGSGFGLIPQTTAHSNQTASTSTTSGAHASVNTSDTTGKPAIAIAQTITGPLVNGDGFEDVRYDAHLANFIGTSKFPRLNMNTIRVNHVGANLVDKTRNEFDITADAVIPGTHNENVSLFLYHNQQGTIRFDGETTTRNKHHISLNGKNATYLAFTNGSGVENYLTWNRGPWIVVLRGMDVPETALLQIAEDVDQQARADR